MKEHIQTAEEPFSDARGTIENFTLTEPINWVGLISTKKGGIRGNHYHPVQEQKLLLVTGKCLSVYKELSGDAPRGENVVHAGEILVTPPNLAHATLFLEDSICINLVSGERHHQNYGEHTIPSKVLSEDEVEVLMQKYEDA